MDPRAQDPNNNTSHVIWVLQLQVSQCCCLRDVEWMPYFVNWRNKFFVDVQYPQNQFLIELPPLPLTRPSPPLPVIEFWHEQLKSMT